MAIEFHCNTCQQQIRVGDGAAGKRGKCPHCGAVVQVPGAAPLAASATATRPHSAAAASVSFACPGCQKTITAPASLAGRKGKCPHCQVVLVVGGGLGMAPHSATTNSVRQPLGSDGLEPLPTAGAGDPLGSGLLPPGSGLAPLGAVDDLFAGLPAAPQLSTAPLPSAQYGAANNPLGFAATASPLGATPAPNPYASPNAYATPRAPVKLMIPAIGMIVISVISIGWLGLITINALLTPLPNQFAQANGPEEEARRAGYKLGRTVGIIVMPIGGGLLNIAAIAGAIQMLRLRGFDTARGGAIAACVPFCSLACLNMPFGIWALIVLYQPDVKRLFH